MNAREKGGAPPRWLVHCPVPMQSARLGRKREQVGDGVSAASPAVHPTRMAGFGCTCRANAPHSWSALCEDRPAQNSCGATHGYDYRAAGAHARRDQCRDSRAALANHCRAGEAETLFGEDVPCSAGAHGGRACIDRSIRRWLSEGRVDRASGLRGAGGWREPDPLRAAHRSASQRRARRLGQLQRQTLFGDGGDGMSGIVLNSAGAARPAPVACRSCLRSRAMRICDVRFPVRERLRRPGHLRQHHRACCTARLGQRIGGAGDAARQRCRDNEVTLGCDTRPSAGGASRAASRWCG